MQVDRGSSWMPGLSDNPPQLPGPPPVVPGQMSQGTQPPRPATVTIRPYSFFLISALFYLCLL